jgi:Spy/CpxP family protein refolding chaperone
MPGLHHPIWGDLAAVGLDVKQKHALDGIRSSMTKSVIRKTADLQIARMELGEVLAGEKVDMKIVEEKVRTVASLHADMELSVIRAVEEAKALLTPAQRTRLEELHKGGDMSGPPPVRPPARAGKKGGPAPRAEKG